MLFHGSVLNHLTLLQPTAGYLYAASDPGLASMFLGRPLKSVFKRLGRQRYGFIADDRSRFIANDRGGTMYVLDGTRFQHYPSRIPPQAAIEWVTTEAVQPMGAIRYQSAIAAIIACGVRLYFIDSESFAQVSHPGASHRAIIRHVVSRHECENDRFTRSLALQRPRQN